MTDCKQALEYIDSSDSPVPYRVIRDIIEWDDDQDEGDGGIADFIFYSEKRLSWVDKERAKLKRAIRKRRRTGEYKLRYRDRLGHDKNWHKSIRVWRGDSPKPQFMSYDVGISSRNATILQILES
tara:strand:+ start:181 stop:555 length:375 start_codon:yes stop_codon:yes gene_type:complete